MDYSLARRALSFATQAHAAIDQRRKYTGDAYIVHPIAVARLVAQVPGHTEEMLAAAYLHDVVEDTPVTLADIQTRFGDKVAQLVGELTNPVLPGQGNRGERVALEHARWASVSDEAMTIKLADVIDNVRSIVRYDPAFARVYLPEKAQLLAILAGGGDPDLLDTAQALVADGFRRLRISPLGEGGI